MRQFSAWSYFLPVGVAAMRWVTALVRSPWYSAPLLSTVSWMCRRCWAAVC